LTVWAAARGGREGSGLTGRFLKIWLNDSADERNLFDYALGRGSSPAASAALGSRFDQVGFVRSWETCGFPPGPYKVIVWVSSLVEPGARNVASVDVEVEGCFEGQTLLRDDLSASPRRVVRLEQPGTDGGWLAPIFADVAAGIDARCTQPELPCQYALGVRYLPGPGDGYTDSGYYFNVNPM